MFRHSAIVTIATMAISIPLWSGGCSHRDPLNYAPSLEAGSPPSFTSMDATVVEEEAGLTSYCPSNKCPAGHTTCPASRFPCDVDLQTDRQNCGACGVTCPVETNGETYECVAGRCVLHCVANPLTLDCDGIDENGCETRPGTNENCAACGDRCLDPAKPCVNRNPGLGPADYGCGCVGDLIYCNENCTSPKRDDENCGACGTKCDRSGDGLPARANAYYGCENSECGHLKCEDGWADCDGNPLNGCETPIGTSENCTTCGDSCAPDQRCAVDTLTFKTQCLCPAGKTFCSQGCIGDLCFGACFDLASDLLACGACGVRCVAQTGQSTEGVCTFGVCSTICSHGRADCNGNSADGCEVNTDSDPRNCGACGNVCDAVAGQACVGGRCMVEPCDQGQPDGGETR